MRKALVLILSMVLTMGILAPAAVAKDDNGMGGGGYYGSGGGGGYTQRDSGVWVPNRDDYIQQRRAPATVPDARKFGQELARDAAKDGVKYVAYSAVGAALHNAGRAIASKWKAMPAAQRQRIPMMPVR